MGNSSSAKTSKQSAVRKAVLRVQVRPFMPSRRCALHGHLQRSNPAGMGETKVTMATDLHSEWCVDTEERKGKNE